MLANLIPLLFADFTTSFPHLLIDYTWLDDHSCRFTARMEANGPPVFTATLRNSDFGRSVVASVVCGVGDGMAQGCEIPFKRSIDPAEAVRQITKEIIGTLGPKEQYAKVLNPLGSAFAIELARLSPLYIFTIRDSDTNQKCITAAPRNPLSYRHLPNIRILSVPGTGIEVSAITGEGELVDAGMLPPPSTPADVVALIHKVALYRTLAAAKATPPPPASQTPSSVSLLITLAAGAGELGFIVFSSEEAANEQLDINIHGGGPPCTCTVLTLPVESKATARPKPPTREEVLAKLTPADRSALGV